MNRRKRLNCRGILHGHLWAGRGAGSFVAGLGGHVERHEAVDGAPHRQCQRGPVQHLVGQASLQVHWHAIGSLQRRGGRKDVSDNSLQSRLPANKALKLKKAGGWAERGGNGLSEGPSTQVLRNLGLIPRLGKDTGGRGHSDTGQWRFRGTETRNADTTMPATLNHKKTKAQQGTERICGSASTTFSTSNMHPSCVLPTCPLPGSSSAAVPTVS